VTVITPEMVRKVIREADFKLNQYAMAYVDALEQSLSEHGQEGIKTQILYIVSNLHPRGQKQTEAKKKLLKLAGHYKGKRHLHGGKKLLRGKPCPKCKSTNTTPRYAGSGEQVWECNNCGSRFSVPCPWWWKEGT